MGKRERSKKLMSKRWVSPTLTSVRGSASFTAKRHGGVCRNICRFVFSDLGWRKSMVLLQTRLVVTEQRPGSGCAGSPLVHKGVMETHALW